MNELAGKLAKKLGITNEEAESMIKQEVARKEASKRYRQSDAYKLRLEMQKEVRKALKAVEASE